MAATCRSIIQPCYGGRLFGWQTKACEKAFHFVLFYFTNVKGHFGPDGGDDGILPEATFSVGR